MSLFENRHYLVQFHKGILCVINKHKTFGQNGYGVYLKGLDAEYWAESIKTAIDKDEANALCKALLN